MAFLTDIVSILPPFWSIAILSLFISFVINISYKFLTNQARMKELKDDIKLHQEEMKKFRDNPKKMMDIQKQAMAKNMEYMRHSFKPTLFTFLPIILIFGWMNSSFAFEPIHPGQEFIATVTLSSPANVTIGLPDQVKLVKTDAANLSTAFTLRSDSPGEYLMSFDVGGKSYDKDVIISDKQEYANPVKTFKKDVVAKIEVNSDKLIAWNLFGWKLGWLGTYIIFSLVFSMGLRKLMKLY
jgi:uncharacterized membrane protein (DUF106 family)